MRWATLGRVVLLVLALDAVIALILHYTAGGSL